MTGRPSTTTVPSTAPTIDVMPPTTEIATMRNDSSGEKNGGVTLRADAA